MIFGIHVAHGGMKKAQPFKKMIYQLVMSH